MDTLTKDSEALFLENMHYFLNPRAVAIIGVSRNPDSFGYPLVEVAQRYGYAGKLYLINPNADRILGLKCYPSLLDVPDEVDTALIMVPKKLATSAIEDCIEKGVKGIVIITAGFAEHGEEGKQHQDELVAKATAKGIRIIGPNTLGFYSARSDLDLMMSGFISRGHTALVTQSGNLTMSLTFPGGERGLGFDYVVDLGNQADLQAHDLIRYFRSDSGTNAIAVHIEGLREGRKFLQEVRQTVPVKPVVVFKSGRTETGARVVSSHTASIAGNDETYKAAFAQSGAIQVESFAEFNSVLLAFKQKKEAKGNRVCIISEGGGDCAVTSDACVQKGLVVPELSATSQEKLSKFVPRNGSVLNPIDLAGWENVVEATEIAMEDDSIDGVIIVGGFAGFYYISPRDYDKEEKHVARMCELLARTTKPVLIYSYFGYREGVFLEQLRKNNIPVFLDHHDAVNAMAALVRYNEVKQRMSGRDFVAALPPAEPAAESGSPTGAPDSLLEPEAKLLLKNYDLPFPEEKLVKTPEEAAAFADSIAYPVVAKIVSKDILHKSDAGCVKLNLADANAVKHACETILTNAKTYDADADIAGLLVTKMNTEAGVEVIIGGLNDPIFGPSIMFGIGGIFVEVLKDVSFRICPIDETDADEMIREIKGYPLLTGARGAAHADLDAIKQALMNVSRLLIENPHIAEVDLNPVKVHPKGLSVLDARMIKAAGK